MSNDISERDYYWNLFLSTCYGGSAEWIKNVVKLIKNDQHPRGKTYIFVGGIKSGKTTALEIICRMLYDKPYVQFIGACRSGEHPVPYLEDKIIFTTSNLAPKQHNDDVYVIETTGERLPFDEYESMKGALL